MLALPTSQGFFCTLPSLLSHFHAPVLHSHPGCPLHYRSMTGRQPRTACAAEPQQQPQRQRQAQRDNRPPAHRIYRGLAGSPTSFPVRPPQRPGEKEKDDEDDYEYVNVGPQYQVPQPELGPLEKRVSTSFLEGMLADNVNLDETDYWFTEPSGGWNQGDKWVRAAKRIPTNMRQNARHAGPGRPEITELYPGQRLRGTITALWLYEGIQVDIGCQWDGLVAIHHETWEEIQFGLTVGQEVIVDVFRVIDVPRCKFPLQLILVEPQEMAPLMMHPLEYDFPFDFDGLDTLEAREEATGMVWSPDVIIKNEVHPLESRTAQENMSMDHAEELQEDAEEYRAAFENAQSMPGLFRDDPRLGVDLSLVDKDVMYEWGEV